MSKIVFPNLIKLTKIKWETSLIFQVATDSSKSSVCLGKVESSKAKSAKIATGSFDLGLRWAMSQV